jgi:phosphoglucomutase/phosphomannomutase
MTTAPHDTNVLLQQVDDAAQAGKLSDGAVKNLHAWISEARYAEYLPEVAQHIEEGKWSQLDDAFWTIIPFGTGGRRGRMYPIGSNAINDRTIGESAQGLADYVKEQIGSEGLSCAIAYDTRHRSRHFAELCASIMVAAGYKVYLLDDYRSTPELSFLVRNKNCSCGIMVTASHNPPSDNAVKVYWSSGGQILPPHDKAVIERVMNVEEIHRTPFDQALKAGQVEIVTAETDAAFMKAVVNESFAGPRDLKIIYSPLHGVGASAVLPALEGDGFTDVELYGPHAKPDGDFPNVPGHVSNPENVKVFEAIIERGQEVRADLILVSDPDCDRIGVAAPLTADAAGEWGTFNGNQIGVLMGDYILEQRQGAGSLTPEHYVVTTLVSTGMLRRIADSYNVKTFDNNQVGFKWIAGVVDEQGPDKYVFGTEESHGYAVGEYARDKDGAVAAMYMAELAAKLKADGQTLHDKLDSLYWQHGYHAERQVSIFMEGAEGMKEMLALMASLRHTPPKKLAGLDVTQARDYQNSVIVKPDGTTEPFDGAPGNLVILDVSAKGNYVAVRPSGTEPKVKFYMFAFEPAEQLHDLETTKEEMAARLDQFEQDLREYAAHA